jgi:uncharacterized protein GlcG (DUF336 family)
MAKGHRGTAAKSTGAIVALVLGFTSTLAGADAPVTCPVDHSQLLSALDAAVGAVNSGFNNQMWAVVVNRDGVTCAVAFSGASRNSQWLLSRQIAAAKAFTANGLSLDIGGSGSGPLSTAQLYPLAQPGGSLFGVQDGNPLDAQAAYAGNAERFGQANDPMIGKRVGGTIVFGGGLGLYQGGNSAVGGLGLSGDTSCSDDQIAREVRKNLGMVPSAPDTISFGPGKAQHPSCG